MKFTLQSAKISSPTDDNHWGGCLVENDLIVLLEIITDGSILASHLGKSVLDQILGKANVFTVKNKEAVKELLESLKGISFVKTVIIGLISESDIYLGCLGKGQVVMVRGEDFGTVVSGGFISTGQISLNDRLIFHSDRLAQIIGGPVIEKLYRTQNIEDFHEDLAAIMSSDKKFIGCAVLALSVSENKYLPVKNSAKKISLKLSPYFSDVKNIILNYYSQKTARQKIFLIAIFVLSLFFVINTASGFYRQRNSQKIKLLNESLEIVNSQYDEAHNLIELNPVRSRELLAGSKLTVSQLLTGTKKNSREHKMLSEWFEKISALEVSAYKIFKLTAVPLYFDVSLTKSGGKADDIAAYKQTKVILDRQNKTVYFLDTQNKQSSVLAGSENVKNGTHIAVHGNFAFVLNEDGIYTIDIEKKEAQKSVNKDDKWGEIVALNAFAGNLYLLDRKNNAIWKYVATDNGLSERRSYINQGVPAKLGNMDKMAIDGSVWVSGEDEIIKYTGGNLGQFSFQGFGDAISGIDAISTSDSEKNIYLLDKSLKRIIVFDKEGLYHSQYQWDSLKDAQNIVASEEEGKIYVLIGNKIYAIEIK